MKYLIVDDEHELYKVMYGDVFKTNEYEVQEVPKFGELNIFEKAAKLIHFSEKINRHLFLPFKSMWNRKYFLSSFNFLENEQYWIIVLNGSLRNYYSKEYFQNLKEQHKNIKLCLILYDSVSNPSADRAIKMLSVFDKVFSFDKGDCSKYEFEYIYSTFSYPEFVKNDEKYSSSVFFVGFPGGREEILYRSLERINTGISNCKFIIPGTIQTTGKEYISTKPISYYEELLYTYNTKCVLEVLREGQTGVSLRTCEAILFNKKLLTNNFAIKDMPFYDSRYVSVFSNPEEIDMDFITDGNMPKYSYEGWFSPLIILRKLNGELP